MNEPTPSSAALPIAHIALRILIVINWMGAAMILALLVALPNEAWIMSAFKLSPSPEADKIIAGFHVIGWLGLAAVPLNYVVLRQLLAIVNTVRAGEPFVAANAKRLQTIGYAIIAVQIISMIIGAVGRAISSPPYPVRLNAGFSINGWLAVLLTFVLSRVFAEGARMRDDLDGTV